MAMKWIVEDKSFRMGHVELHEELCSDRSKVDGGGAFVIDRSNKVIHLYGKSHDFGQTSIDKVKEAIEEGWISKRLDDYTYRFSNQIIYADALEDEVEIELEVQDEG